MVDHTILEDAKAAGWDGVIIPYPDMGKLEAFARLREDRVRGDGEAVAWRFRYVRLDGTYVTEWSSTSDTRLIDGLSKFYPHEDYSVETEPLYTLPPDLSKVMVERDELRADAMRYRALRKEAFLDYVEFNDVMYESASDLDAGADALIAKHEGK